MRKRDNDLTDEEYERANNALKMIGRCDICCKITNTEDIWCEPCKKTDIVKYNAVIERLIKEFEENY